MFEPSPCEKNGKSGKSHAACSSLGAHQKQAQPQTPLAMKGEQRRCILQPASQWSSWHKKKHMFWESETKGYSKISPKYLQNHPKSEIAQCSPAKVSHQHQSQTAPADMGAEASWHQGGELTWLDLWNSALVVLVSKFYMCLAAFQIRYK